MKLLKIFLLSLTLMIIPAVKTSPVNVALGTAVAIGSTASFLVWLPQTLMVIQYYGFKKSIYTTHSIRLLIDALAISAGVKLALSK